MKLPLLVDIFPESLMCHSFVSVADNNLPVNDQY